MSDALPIGAVAWFDLTVEDADGLRDFYREVVGWQPEAISMGEYSDYAMNTPADGNPTAGVCHARGPNADLPAQWLLYVRVERLEQSMSRCREQGGTVVAGPKNFAGQGTYCVIRDPAGAYMALFEPNA